MTEALLSPIKAEVPPPEPVPILHREGRGPRADGMGYDRAALRSGFVVVGTEGQTATNPRMFLHLSYNPIIPKILIQTPAGIQPNSIFRTQRHFECSCVSGFYQ